MSNRLASFFVHGLPIPQGSKNAFRSGNRCVIVDVKDKELKAWRGEISEIAARNYLAPPWDGAACVQYTFYFDRIKSHYRANGELSASAPERYIKTPDLDKLERAVGDALTKVVLKDDCRVDHSVTRKRYADDQHPQGVLIEVFGNCDECVGEGV